MIYSIMHLISPTRFVGIIDGRSTAFLIYSGQAGPGQVSPSSRRHSRASCGRRAWAETGPGPGGCGHLIRAREAVARVTPSRVMVTPETRSEERGQVTWDTGDHTWEELLTDSKWIEMVEAEVGPVKVSDREWKRVTSVDKD